LGKKGYQDSVSKNKLAMVAFAVIPAIWEVKLGGCILKPLMALSEK
jgi:hypothetical protein